MFDDLEYTRGRLVDTIVRMGEEPIYIIDINKRYKKAIYSPLMDMTITDECKLTDLNLEAVPLGYINYDGGSVFAMRKPMRKDWRQGLRLANMHFSGGNPFVQLPYTELRNTIVGAYTKPVELTKALKTNRSVAFARHWAVTHNGDCLYKDKVVGVFNGGITLSDKYTYLGEYLQETLDAANH